MKPFDLGGPIIFPEGWVPVMNGHAEHFSSVIEDKDDNQLCIGCFSEYDVHEWSSSYEMQDECEDLPPGERKWTRWHEKVIEFVPFDTTGCETLEEVCALARMLYRMGE